MAGPLVAAMGAEVVGLASVPGVESGVAEVSLLVEDGWQRRGLGTRPLSGAAGLARGHGADEVVPRSPTHNPALTSWPSPPACVPGSGSTATPSWSPWAWTASYR